MRKVEKLTLIKQRKEQPSRSKTVEDSTEEEDDDEEPDYGEDDSNEDDINSYCNQRTPPRPPPAKRSLMNSNSQICNPKCILLLLKSDVCCTK